MREEHPFEPIIFNESRILILGSFPSRVSVKESFYYAHKSNRFWEILGAVTGYPVNNRDQKLWLLKESGFALWDMISSCARDNSLDSSIEDETPNDIPSLLESHPNINKLVFTGKKAQAVFEFNFSHLEIERAYLPSPSSAYAAMSIEKKIEIYKRELTL